MLNDGQTIPMVKITTMTAKSQESQLLISNSSQRCMRWLDTSTQSHTRERELTTTTMMMDDDQRWLIFNLRVSWFDQMDNNDVDDCGDGHSPSIYSMAKVYY